MHSVYQQSSVSTLTCFNALAPSSGCIIYVLAKVQKIFEINSLLKPIGFFTYRQV